MRSLVAAVLALAVVGGVGYAGWWTLRAQARPDPVVGATAAIDEYLAAWSEWDVGAMQRLVRDPPADFTGRHRQMHGALRPAATRVSHGAVTLSEQTDAEASTPVEVELDLPYAGTYAYDTAVTVTRRQGEWRVRWDLTTLHPDLRDGLAFDVESAAVDRAPILDRDGQPLTGPGEVQIVGFEPRRIDDPQQLIVAFQAHLPRDVETLIEELERDDLRPTWFYPVTTLRPSEWERVQDDIANIPGIVVRAQDERTLHEEGFALHVIGVTETVDAAAAAALGPPYDDGDLVGRYGLEAVLEERLTGTDEVTVVLRQDDRDDAGELIGEIVTTLVAHQGDAAEAVTTTLDMAVQQAVERALDPVEQPAAMVVLDAATGAVRAAASRPLTGENRAFLGAYPPGSTFKVVTAAALLRAGVTPDAPVECPEEVVVGGLRIGNAGGLALGEATLTQAFANSCNTTFAPLAAELAEGALADTAATFGFHPIDGGLRGAAEGTYDELALEAYAGSFPPPQDVAERAAASFGQGRVQATTLHMATVAAAVAGGSWNPPFLLAGDAPDGGTELEPATAAALRQLMTAAVADGSVADANLPAGVGGKTGSAEFDQSGATHAWFIGFRDDLAFAVLVEAGGSGAAVAAPIAASFLTELDAVTADG